MNSRIRPVYHEDIFELPARARPEQPGAAGSGRGRCLSGVLPGLLMGTGLALLPAFIPAPAQAADLYIGGGGGGGLGSSNSGGAGATNASPGNAANLNGYGGGAYVGSGGNAHSSHAVEGKTDPNNSANFPLLRVDAKAGANTSGGAGGSASAAGSDITVGNLHILAGAGGVGSSTSEPGGSGGSASAGVGHINAGDVYIQAGTGGIGSHGGSGGQASLEAKTLSANSVTLKSGLTGNSGKDGGSAALIVTDTLNARVLTFEKIAGTSTVTVTVKTLDVTQGDTALTLTNTIAGNGTPGSSGVFFENIDLGGGRTLTVSGGAYAFNTLNVRGQGTYTGNLDATAKNLNFYLPAGLAAGQPLLNVNGTTDITNSAVKLIPAGASLRPGDQLILLDSSLTLTGSPANSTVNAQGGVTLRYVFDLAPTGQRLLATVNSVGLNPQTKALPEGFLSGAALVGQGADLVAGAGLAEAVRAARSAGASGPGASGLAGFGAIEGGQSRYNTGSHVDVRGLALLAGLSKGFDLDPGRLTLGAFFEYGRGSYDSYNSFSNAASVHGEGDISHYGGGLLGRMDFTGTDSGRFYAEVSARLGKAHNEYDSADLRDAGGNKASYDSSSAYYGLHLGGGYIWNINEKASLDLYGKYFWTRQEGDSVRLSTGDPVRFKAVDSQRLRLGSRFGYAVNEHISPYIGAAWEYEFDGKAQAATNGFAIDAPSLRGGTGIGELGLTLTPSTALPLSFDLGVQGYAGKREGVTGSLQAKWEF